MGYNRYTVFIPVLNVIPGVSVIRVLRAIRMFTIVKGKSKV